MNLPTDKQLLDHVEAVIKANGLFASHVGMTALGDPNLIGDMRRGRSLTLTKAGKLLRYLSHYAAPERPAA